MRNNRVVERNYTIAKTDNQIIGHIGFDSSVDLDFSTSKTILITGANSYIGDSFRIYANNKYPNLKIDVVDMIDESWRQKDFSKYDIVYHVAGIAHSDVSNVDDTLRELYYKINTDLAIEVCEKSKKEGVHEFIFMSSMIIYGDSLPYKNKRIIDKHTVPNASNFYGDSKLQADVAVRDYATDNFKVIVIRPPMVYGKNSKGNYRKLANIAKRVSIFPYVENFRSMIHIDNLCEFISQVMLIKKIEPNAVVLFPQNSEWSNTCEMVKEISVCNGKKMLTIGSIFAKMAISICSSIPGKIGNLTNKAFGNSCYDHKISEYTGISYQVVSLKESIKITETDEMNKSKKLCIVNCFDTYEHRVDLLYDYFKRIDANVKVLTSDFKHIEKVKRNDNKKDFEFISSIPYYKNLSVKRLFSHYAISKKIFKIVDKENYDLLWVFLPPNSFAKGAASYKKNHKNTKLVFDLIDLWPETMPISKYKSCFPFSYWRTLRDKYLNSADEIVTECNLYQSVLPKCIDRKKIHTIYLAREVKTTNQKLNLPDDRIALCYLGSINNIIDISSIEKLIVGLTKFKSVEIHIVGDGEKREIFIDACKTAGAKVIYHGKIYDTDEKQKVFNSCHYGLNFMKDSVFVGLTMKSIDYFEAGLPIINNIHGDTWDIVEKTLIGFNFSNSTDYESVCNYDLSIREKVRKYFIANFSVEKFKKDISNIGGLL